MTKNTQYLAYGELARKQCNIIEGAGRKQEHLALFALVLAHEQASLSNNVNIKEAAFIDGTLHRKQKNTAYDTILCEVFGFVGRGEGKDYYTSNDVNMLARMLPIASYVIVNGGTKAVGFNDKSVELHINCDLVDIASGTKDKVALNGVDKRSMAMLRKVAKSYWDVRSKPKVGHENHKPEVEEKKDSTAPREVITIDNLPKTVEAICAKIRKADVKDISPTLNRRLQELLIELIGLYGADEAMSIYMKDAA